MHLDRTCDEEPLERLRSGDGSALGELYERYKSALYGYCFRLLRDGADAEDAVHETFIKIAYGVNSLDRADAFQTWLYRIARNEALMILRRDRKFTGSDPDLLQDEQTPLNILVAQNRAEAVQHALGQLRMEYRDILVLREYEGLSYAEIAAVTDTTIDSVKSRIFKARKALSEKLETWFKERDLL